MVKHPGQPDSLFRPDSATWRRETYTFRFATQEQRPELSDSLVNSPRPVNRLVRTGPYRDFELVNDGGAS
jgi:hypothetical protein